MPWEHVEKRGNIVGSMIEYLACRGKSQGKKLRYKVGMETWKSN
jgi:hypothetical protein